MSDIAINPVTRRVQFTGNTGTGPYAFTFNILVDGDIAVFKGTTELTLTTDYTVSINANGTGSVTLTVALIASDVLTIIGGRELSRTTDFVTAGDLLASSLNEQLDSNVIMTQQLDEKLGRGLFVNPGDVFTDLELPLKDDRKGTVLGFNATTGDPEPGPEIADVDSLANISADIKTLAEIQDGTVATDAITNVNTIRANVTTVSNISGNVTTVAGNTTNINTVAGNNANITTVAGIDSDVTTVSGISSDVTTVAADGTDIGVVAGISSDVTTVSGVSTEIGLLGTADAVSDMNTLAVAGIIADMETVSDNISVVSYVGDVDRMAAIIGVAANASNINTVAADGADIGTVATSIASVNTAATNIASINTNATNITDIQNASANAATATTQAGIATTQAGIATTKASEAATSETNAATSETNAATSETNASTSETNAATSATNAASSATSASGSASAALNFQTQAGIYSSNAASSASSALSSKNSASSSATNSANSATSASSSASTATTKASEAAVSASAASTSETNADTSEANALTYSSNAATSAAAAASSAAGIAGYDLDVIAETKGVTAVDVFVYDTSKDSDGGAWRKRTQATSWYNETLNTATRGSRKEFPAVAVIVAESTQVTIYDGDDPSLPMWMVFNRAGDSYFLSTSQTVTSLSALNGSLVFGMSSTGIRISDFIGDLGRFIRSTNDDIMSSVAERNSGVTRSPVGTNYLVNGNANDVAMTVLPNAPIDAATGLPVPTIAVATDGGVSVIKDDGTVVDSALTSATSGAYFTDDGFLLVHRGGTSSATYTYIVENITADGFSQLAQLNEFSVPSFVPSSTTCSGFIDAGDFKVRGGANRNGISLLALNSASVASSMVAYTTSDYNTGWMNGDIKLATLSDTDDTDVTGSELVTNGTFDTDTSGWEGNGYGTPTLAVDTGRLKVTSDGTTYLGVRQALSGLSASKTYTATATVDVGTYTGNLLFGIAGSATYVVSSGNAPSNKVVTFTFTGYTDPTIQIYMSSGHSSGATFFVDNISVRLAEEDRSVNGNGLQVFGTVTKNPVATGADLVAYSGFSASNYLEQPYNSDLDFGTGDFCVMGWLIAPVAPAIGNFFLDRDGPTGGRLGFFVSAGSVYTIICSTAAVLTSTGIAPKAGLSFLAVVRETGVLKFYVDGQLRFSAANTNDISSTDAILTIGTDAVTKTTGLNSSLALLRISATAPTAEQLAKIYNDEKHLFTEGSQATLYGTSDAVTALAYDDSTELLHVGTSAGRSVFQGLRRVDNTTTAVGTAISASNGLVVEE